MPTPRQLATLALVVLMIFSAGCAGWGQDGPADSNETETDGPSTAPENDTTNETESNESNETDTTNTTDNDSSVEGTNTSEDTQSSESSDNTSNEDENEDGDGDESTATQDTTSSQSAEAQPQPQPQPDGDGERSSDSSSINSEEQEQEPERHTLTVTVTSPEGNAVEGADVSVVTYDGGESVAEATTNETGEATFEVENGDYEIIVGNTQFGQPSDDRLVTVDGEDTTREIKMVNEGGMYDYSMTVQVVDSEGNPISNELVQIGTPGEDLSNHVTDENGEVTITFTNSSEGDAVQQTIIVRGEHHSASVAMGEQTEQITATGDRETYDLTVNAGTEGEQLTLERWDGATTTKTTGEDGTATFTVYPGEYTVTDGDGQQTGVTVDGDATISVENTTVAMQTPLEI